MSDFFEKVEGIAKRSTAAERQALTEEATKTAVILPLLQCLGFDVFNLDEVTPEFVADVGTKKGEKVDFAVKIDGRVEMLVEAKPINCKLGEVQFNQLFRYFHATEARLALLTNGKEIWFFSDTEEQNKMDAEPFFKFDLQKFDKAQVDELARFQKHCFSIDTIIEAASNLKYVKSAAAYLKRQLVEPEEEFIRLVGKKIHPGVLTKTVQEQIRPSIQSAFDQIIRDRIQESLNITLSDSSIALKAPSAQVAQQEIESEDALETTDEELEGYMIIRAILARHMPVDRVFLRDAKSYCAILMDDNNRKPICRLYFNSPTTKNVGLFDAEKNETKIRVDGPVDLYRFIDQIEAAARSYL